MARWTFEHIGKGHSAAFIERQRQRGALGGKAKGKAYDDKKAQAKALSDAGVSNAAIARQLGADRKTIIKWSKNGFE